MNAVIYTPSDTEYELFTRILREEAPDAQIVRDSDDGHFHCESEQDFVVVSVDGAKGMELAIKREINYRQYFHFGFERADCQSNWLWRI